MGPPQDASCTDHRTIGTRRTQDASCASSTDSRRWCGSWCSSVPKLSPTVSLTFYGYPPALIAEWCCVTRRQAVRLCQGTARPSPATLKLFRLHADGRVLTAAFRDFRVHKDRIYDEAGVGTTALQLRMYGLMMQWAADVARRDEKLSAEYHNLLEVASG